MFEHHICHEYLLKCIHSLNENQFIVMELTVKGCSTLQKIRCLESSEVTLLHLATIHSYYHGLSRRY